MNQLKELLTEYNPGENQPDIGGGMLYARRYSTEKLLLHREEVVKALLRDLSLTVQKYEGNDALVLPEGKEDYVMTLLEEIGVINQALSVKRFFGGDFSQFVELVELLDKKFDELSENGFLDELSELLGVMPIIIADLYKANSMNRVLSEKDFQDLVQISDHIVALTDRLDNIMGMFDDSSQFYHDTGTLVKN